MARLISQEYILEIEPTTHYYADYCDTNEFYYNICIYKGGEKQKYPLGRNGEIIDEFNAEIWDYMISQICFEAIYTHKENCIMDLFNGGFDMLVIPDSDHWRLEFSLNPYYLEHPTGLELIFEIKEQELFDFGYALRQEEIRIIGKPVISNRL